MGDGRREERRLQRVVATAILWGRRAPGASCAQRSTTRRRASAQCTGYEIGFPTSPARKSRSATCRGSPTHTVMFCRALTWLARSSRLAAAHAVWCVAGAERRHLLSGYSRRLTHRQGTCASGRAACWGWNPPIGPYNRTVKPPISCSTQPRRFDPLSAHPQTCTSCFDTSTS